MRKGEVWFAKFPFEENETVFKPRPVVVLNEESLMVLSVKVTSHGRRNENDVEIVHWEEAHLKCPSVARVSKARELPKENFYHKLGELHPEDMKRIEMAYAYYLNEQ